MDPVARATPDESRTGEIAFEQVRPILEKHCWNCHGAEKREAGLRLDSRQVTLLGSDSGKVIVPGKSHESKLLQLISSQDPDDRMPPEGERLSKSDIDLISRWIDRGAMGRDDERIDADSNSHWAYQPIRAIAPPINPSSTWPKNAIDRFVLEPLAKRGIRPSSEAERHTLIRRLYLDLLGLLPPTDHVQAFVRDDRETAYEELVDELLKSPHFGERWGRHWLDMARYADSDGYEKDNARPDAYRWRDWVIDAVNQDMPFDQFTIEQLAGDLLPDANAMQRLATAFHRQTLTNTEGGTDQEQFRVEACFDRTETTGAVWLGLTVGCARCHSHKYDAIAQREYYQLFAFFNNADEKSLVVPKSLAEVDAYQVDKQRHDAELQAAMHALQSEQNLIDGELKAWETESIAILDEQSKHPFVRDTLKEPRVESDSEVTFTKQKDESFLVSGKNPEKAVYRIEGKSGTGPFDTLRLDVLSDKSLPAKGPGRVKHGNFVLSEITLEIADNAEFKSASQVDIVDALADHEQSGNPWLAKHAYDKDSTTGWAIGNQYGKDHWVEFRLSKHIAAAESVYVRVSLSQQHGMQHTIGRWKVSLQLGAEPKNKFPDNIAKALRTPAAKRSKAQQKEILEHYSSLSPRTKHLVERLEEVRKKAPAKPEISARVIGERESNPRETFVLRRGEFLEPIKELRVEASAFATLPPLKPRRQDGPADRLDLAQWLVASDHPLVPRVTVNHVWRLLFGVGLVKSASDFGIRGERPTHPELLDWLARDFVENKRWSRKQLIKEIVMSATYRQSSRMRSELMESDPTNQWLARQNRLRVEGEIVRDLSLDASGLLSRKVGGPSVFPALPPGVAELSYAGNFKWKPSEGEDRYRRGMYTFFKRTSPHPNLIAFDCPDANLTCVERNKSNTPIQALVAMNNESYFEAAQAFAKRILTHPDLQSDSIRMAWAVQTCLSRMPDTQELDQLMALLLESQSAYASRNEDAAKLVGSYVVPNTDLARNAAWIVVTRVLLNLDEFITRE
jgi:hypothetical protein